MLVFSSKHVFVENKLPAQIKFHVIFVHDTKSAPFSGKLARENSVRMTKEKLLKRLSSQSRHGLAEEGRTEDL